MSFFRLFIVGFFLSCCYPAFAGVSDKIEYNKASVDSLFLKSWHLMIRIPDSALYYADVQKEIAEKINYKFGLINAYYLKGNIYNEIKCLDLAAREFYTALSLIEGNDNLEFLKKKALVLQGIGYSYEKAFNYDMAELFYRKGLEVALFTHYERPIADLNYNLGICFRAKGEIETSLFHYNQALEIYKKNNEYVDVADVYNVMGFLNFNEGKFDTAQRYYREALKVIASNDISTPRKAWYINNIGEVYFRQGKYDEAKHYYNQALKVAEEYNDSEKVKYISNNLGDVYLKQNNYAEAITYYQKCIALGDEEKLDEEMKRAYKQLTEAYKKMGKYEEAWIYNEKFLAQTTSLQETKYTLIGQNAEHRIKEVEREHQLSEEIAKTTRRKLMSATLALGFSLLVLLYVLKSGKVD